VQVLRSASARLSTLYSSSTVSPSSDSLSCTSMRSARTTVIDSPPGRLRGILPHLRGKIKNPPQVLTPEMARRWHDWLVRHRWKRYRPGVTSGLYCWFGVEPPPESNRRPHPYH
jgi:hypothetical protein